MTRREREIIHGARGQLLGALMLCEGEPPDEQHVRGWIEQAIERLDRLLDEERDK